MDSSDARAVEAAERMCGRRSRMIWVQAVLFTGWQGSYFLSHAGDPTRTVENVRIAAWAVWAAALLLLLLTGGGWIWGPAVRRLLNDELSVHNRHEGQRAGFWGAMAACLAVYLFSFYEPLGPRDVVHLVLTFAIGTAFFRYGWLERRAERAG
jgi:hypothetical protein